jgi:hypothetical protein
MPASPKPAPPFTSQLLDKVRLDGFVDAYASFNSNFMQAQSGTNALRAFDVSNGFALNWIGADATFDPDPVGATVGLRLGPGTQIYNLSDSLVGLGDVKQAFASYRPGGEDGRFTMDFGKFDPPYGSEVADSQLSMNYTRSVLFTCAQPLFFTGLRADWAPVTAFDAKVFLVDGWNRSVATQLGKSAGLQLVFKPVASVVGSVGYMLSPEQQQIAGSDVARFRHTVDTVFDLNPTASARVLVNGTFDTQEVLSVTGRAQQVVFYGANLAARYSFLGEFAVAERVEAYRDPQGFSLSGFTSTGNDTTIYDNTLTVEYNLSPNLKVLVDGRVDKASRPLFPTSAAPVTTQFTTTLGVIVSASSPPALLPSAGGD